MDFTEINLGFGVFFMNGAEFLIGFDSRKKLRLIFSLAQGAGRQ